MVNYVPCCVPGCKDQSSSRHRFPNPCKYEERFKKWLEIINNEKLKGMQSTRVYNNYRVCHMHFTPKDECRNNYLNRLAVPSRNILIDAVEELEVLQNTSSTEELLVQPSTSTLQEAKCDSPLPNACKQFILYTVILSE